jgi:hypothetical protein
MVMNNINLVWTMKCVTESECQLIFMAGDILLFLLSMCLH